MSEPLWQGLGGYSIIYADPPWQYADKMAHTSYEIDYPTMRTAEIAALPVSELAAEDCTLFLWVVSPLLPDAFTVLRGWQFDFVTVGFVWLKVDSNGDIKPNGLGHWTIPNVELVLIARRGNPKPISKCTQHQVVKATVKRHSEKPIEVKRRILEMMGDLKRIELWARYYSEGWDAWGNQAQLDPQTSLWR